MNALLVAKPKAWFGVYYRFANTDFTCFEKLKSGVVLKRLSMKPLGTDSDVENGLTTPKSSFEKTMSPSCFSASESVSETENPTTKET
ncbi:hypothetical protein HJ031_21790 [Vibrio parahaemolyticus]|nr:hypothetical protein [Vibrio parahaemolyticus]